MKLKSAAFHGNQRLEKAADNNPLLCQGESGNAVALVQAALITLKYKLPRSTTKKYGAPDGIFGEETKKAVMAFQADQKLKADSIVGQKTLLRLDSLLPLASPASPPELPKPAMPVSSDF